MSRAMNLDRFHLRLERARARLFPPSKWTGLFPSAAYRRSAPPQLAWGILTSCGLKGFLRLGCFAMQKREACASPQWTAGRLTHCGAEYYRGNKGQRVFFCTLAFSASHEACRRMAVYTIQPTRKPHQTREPRGLLPSGGKTRPSRMSLHAPARLWRAVRGQGALPLARAARPVAERW